MAFTYSLGNRKPFIDIVIHGLLFGNIEVKFQEYGSNEVFIVIIWDLGSNLFICWYLGDKNLILGIGHDTPFAPASYSFTLLHTTVLGLFNQEIKTFQVHMMLHDVTPWACLCL